MKKIVMFALALGFTLSGFAQKADSTKATTIRISGAGKTGIEPLIIIDGNKQYLRGTSSLNQVDQNNIESITVWKDSSAVSRYGPEGFGGIIEIKTKNGFLSPSAMPYIKADSSFNLLGNVSNLKIYPRVRPNATTPLNLDPAIKTFLLYKDTDQKAKPIYVLDGEKVSDVKNLDPSTIESVNIIKDASGKDNQYGGKGKDGLIIITTKKAKPQPKKNN